MIATYLFWASFGLLGMLIYALVKIRRLDKLKDNDTISEVVLSYLREDIWNLLITSCSIPVMIVVLKLALRMKADGNIPFVADEYEWVISDLGNPLVMLSVCYNANSWVVAILGSKAEAYYTKKKSSPKKQQ